jgi:hypothetical protein
MAETLGREFVGYILNTIQVVSKMGVSFAMVNLKQGCSVSWLHKNCVVQLVD